jgi:hypothetical protein
MTRTPAATAQCTPLPPFIATLQDATTREAIERQLAGYDLTLTGQIETLA